MKKTKLRSAVQKIIDFITFPLRAVTLFEYNKWGLTSRKSERYDYVAREVIGYCLDVGCGKYNRFINEFLNGNGKGVDVYPYEGLTEENVVKDLTHFPFDSEIFDSATFIANVNHIPKSQRDSELLEAYRCLKNGGNIIITMGTQIGEILSHKIVGIYDKIFKTHHDMDSERGMDAEEEYYINDSEIIERLTRAGFKDIEKKYFITQWGLNHLFVAWKK